jgi:hypothetical protein
MTVSRRLNYHVTPDSSMHLLDGDEVAVHRPEYVTNLERYWHRPRRQAGLYELSEPTKRFIEEFMPKPLEFFGPDRVDIRAIILLTLANRRYATYGVLNHAVIAAGGTGVRDALKNMVNAGEVIAEGSFGHRTYSLPRPDDD